MRERWREVTLLVRAAVHVDRWQSLLALVLYPVSCLGPPLVALGLKHFLDAVAAQQTVRAMIAAAAVAIGGVFLWEFVGHLLSARQRQRLQERVSLYMDQRIAGLCAGIPTVAHLERPEFLDRIELLRTEGWWLGRAVFMIPGVLGQFVRSVAIFPLLAALDPWLILLPAAAAPTLWFGARGERHLMAAEDDMAAPLRRAGHLFWVATNSGPAKETGVFGLTDEVRRRQSRAWAEVSRIYSAAALRASLFEASARTIYAVGVIAAVARVAARTADGTATAGDLVLALTLAVEVHGHIAATGSVISRLRHVFRAAGRLAWLEDYAVSASATGGEAPPARLTRGISLEDVGFVYPGAASPTLQGLSLDIPAGSVLAIVGENGAGKTTLVKLLCRMYEPVRGRIRLDDLDLADIDVEAWRARTAAAFQDFSQFEFILREVVGVGDLSRIDQSDAVDDALVRAGAGGLAHELPNGLATQLGTTFPGGTGLSGGQWQKTAVGRAMMRRGPLLLILDEPTAALDAPTEHDLFDRYVAAARTAAKETGGVTLLVSHRFSTVRVADRIVVMAHGQIAEAGTHDELMARDGIYAELYERRASNYR